jgi:uncharacterized metal-binding protein
MYGLAFAVVWGLAQLGMTTPAYHREWAAWVQELIRAHSTETWAFVIGFCTGSAAHTIADWLVTNGNGLLGSHGRRLRQRYRDHDQWRPRHKRRR